MSHCIEKLPHDCGTSDGLQVFQGDREEYSGYCFACDTYVADPYPDGKSPPKKQKVQRTPEEIQAELDEIDNYPTINLPDRGLKSWALSYYDIKVGVSEQDGKTPVFHYYPYYSDGVFKRYKVRFVPDKKMWAVGHERKQPVDLFGWEQALATGAKRLYITEGELDAVALYQALKEKQVGTKYADYNPAVVSLTNGSGGAKNDITRNMNKIRHNFKEVVLVFDRDEAGDKARKEVLQIYPTARTVDIPGKDANDCVKEGKSRALADACLFKAETPKNTRIVLGSTLYEAGREQPAYGLAYPWEGLTKLTRGMRFGETCYFGAGVKMGKSEFRNSLAAHLITDHDMKVFMAAPEETNKKTYQMVLGKIAGRLFHDPDREFDFKAYDEAAKVENSKLHLLNLYQHVGWSSLRADIMEAAHAGCKAIFIDPITNLTNGVPSGEANTALQEIAQELAAIALDLELMVWIFCHLKAPEAGASHERGGKVMSHQFAGSRAMMRSCHMMLGFEGNKDPDLDEEARNVRKLVILEDREFGSSGFVRLWWNKETGLFTEVKDVA